VCVISQDPLHREKWIQYSAKDAVCTFDLHQKLAKFLSETSWEVEGVQNVNGKDCIQVMTKGTMYNFYENYLRKFGEVLTDMERNGIKVMCCRSSLSLFSIFYFRIVG
jgi:DNA polymerase-1